jgi:hypothetical protein
VKPTPRIERIADAAAEIFGGPPDELQFIHAVLAQVSLPYRKPPAGTVDYVRTNGRASVAIQNGFLLNPETRQMEKQGLPYGSKPRLLLLHVCSEAMRTRKAEVSVGDSMSGFMKQLGLKVSGGKKGTIGAFKEQLNRLAASRITFGFMGEDKATTLNTVPIEKFEAWFPKDPSQQTLWASSVTLSQPFFDSLKVHALPIDPRAIKSLQHSARALDCYVWLAHRLPRVRSRKGDFVSWKALHGQFGGTITHLSAFQREFTVALKQALAEYLKAVVEDADGGLRLHRSPSPIDP